MSYTLRLRTLTFTLLFALFAAVPSFAQAADLDTMIGQMLMAGFRGYQVNEESPIVRDIQERHLGGVVLFDYDVALEKHERNIKNPEQVAKLTRDLKRFAAIPLLVSVDQEGGRVQRLKPEYGFVGTPSAQELGIKDDKLIRATGALVGKTLQKTGFNLDFAPVVDVNVDPQSPAIGKLGRSFSMDPLRVAHVASQFLKGLNQEDVIGSLKHFPGHGSAGADSHLGLTDVTNTWSRQELIPYQLLIQNGQAEMIMTAHIFNAHLDSDYPATLSHKVITGILREELGYEGVVITDDMNMKAITDHFGREEAIRLAIEAGADILLFGNNLSYDPNIVKTANEIIRKLVDNETIPEERIRQSFERIMRLKEKLN